MAGNQDLFDGLSFFDVHEGPDPDSPDFYRRLGIVREASPDAIREAYYELIREYPPERYPDQFRAIREAFETLADGASREQYDTQNDPVVKALVDRGLEASHDEEHETAIRSFRRALVLRPSASFVRSFLGSALRDSGDLEGALGQFVRLTEESPDNAGYWTHRGFVEWRLDRNSDAEGSFRQALRIDDEFESAHVGLARALVDQGRAESAILHLEAAIRADGAVDFDDFTYFFELVRVQLRSGELDKIDEIAARIESVIEEEWQARRAAYQFAQSAQEMLEFKAFKPALALAEKSMQLLPGDPFITALTQFARDNKALLDEWSAFVDDSEFRGPLKFLLAAMLQSHFEHYESEEQEREAVRGAAALLMQDAAVVEPSPQGHRTLGDQLDALEYRYFRLSNLMAERFKETLRTTSRTAGWARITCPHCGEVARAMKTTARLECPKCGKSLDYNASTGQVTSSGRAVAASQTVEEVLWIAVKFMIFVAIVAALRMCWT
jgi:curved DNA-binding protein CbpA